MQPKSISKDASLEHAHQPSFPTSGDNFTTIASLNGVNDSLALLEAIDLYNDYLIALHAFEHAQKCTGTPES